MRHPHSDSPAEGLRALTRSLSAAVEARGLIMWLLAPLMRLLLRRRLREIEASIAALAELAEAVANGTWRPRPAPAAPRTRKARATPSHPTHAQNESDWPEPPWPIAPGPAVAPQEALPRPKPARPRLRPPRPTPSPLVRTLPPGAPWRVLHPHRLRRSQIFDESAPKSDARPSCSVSTTNARD